MARDFTFFLGTHQPRFLWSGHAKGPMFIAVHRMLRKSRYPKATVPFALDSGGFNHLMKEGKWTTSPQEYAERALRIQEETDNMLWAAVQDWVCAPPVLSKTGKTIREHQKRTVESFHVLREIAPEVSWTPVLQGVTRHDFLQHVEDHEASGISLSSLDVVGVGSVASRQKDDEVLATLELLHERGIKIHGFGIKLAGLRRCVHLLKSSDSMAWSFEARRQGGDANGQEDAEKYRHNLIREMEKVDQQEQYRGIFEFFPTGDL